MGLGARRAWELAGGKFTWRWERFASAKKSYPLCPLAAQQRPRRQPQHLEYTPPLLPASGAGSQQRRAIGFDVQCSGRGDKTWPLPLSMSDPDPVVAAASVARSLPGGGSHAKLGFCQLNNQAEMSLSHLWLQNLKPRRVSCISSQMGSHSGGIGWKVFGFGGLS